MRRKVLVSVAGLSMLGTAVLVFNDSVRPPVAQGQPLRGQLLDYYGTPLTAHEVRWRPAINMEVLRRYTPASIARFLDALADELDVDHGRLSSVNPESWRAVRERQVPAQITESRMQELKVWLAASEWRHSPQLIRYIEVPGRMYPQREVAASLIGFVGSDGQGLDGMEHALDRTLSEGRDARLSIDIDLQRQLSWTMQRAIGEHALREANAVVIEIGPHRIASIVSLPSFDPAVTAQRLGPQVRLKPATDIFQAGPMLEPFFLNEVLDSSLEETPSLRARFVRAEPGTGIRMVDVLGYERARDGLLRAELLDRVDVDLRGVAVTFERRFGSAMEIQRDFGNGAGVALSLLRYSTSLAALIDGRPPRPARILMASTTPPEYPVASSRAAQAQALRAAMVERARRQAADRRADFGGMWTNYSDRIEKGEPVRRAAIAMFTPAANPKYLLTMTFVTSAAVDEDALLEIGRDALSAVVLSSNRDDVRQFL